MNKKRGFMKIKKLILLGLASFGLFSCGEVESSSKEFGNECILLSKTISTNQVEGSVYNLEGNSYFKWNGALFKINPKKVDNGINVLGTDIYMDDKLLSENEIDSNLFINNKDCIGTITYANGSYCNDDIDLLEAPYLSSLYFGEHKVNNLEPESSKIYSFVVEGEMKIISDNEGYFTYKGILYKIGTYTSLTYKNVTLDSNKLTTYEGLDKSIGKGRICLSSTGSIHSETNISTPYLSIVSVN